MLSSLPQINENGVVSFGNPVPLYSEDKIVLPIGKDPEVSHMIFASNLSTFFFFFFWQIEGINPPCLRQIIWETQKWHDKFSRPERSWVIDLNDNLHALISISRTTCLAKILMPFLSVSDNLLWQEWWW